MDSRASPSHKEVEVILNDQKEWPYFIQLVKAQCIDLGIWDKNNPEIATPPAALAMPARVTVEMVGAAAGTAIQNLTPEQSTAYRMLQDNYKFDHQDALRERIDTASVHNWVRSHITKRNLDVIATSTSLHDTLKRLKARCQPTDEAKKLDLKIQWQQLMNSDTKSQDPLQILDKIINLHQKLVKESIFDDPDAEGINPDKMPLLETLNLIARIDRVYADTKRSSIYDPGYFIKSVPDLITNFRNVLHTKPLQARQKSHFAFNTEGEEASFKGYNTKGQKSSNKKSKCPCGNISRNPRFTHEPYNCTYCTGVSRGNFKPIPEVQKKVDEALKDPKVKAYVDKNIADHKKRVEEKESQQSSAQDRGDPEPNNIYFTTFHDTGDTQFNQANPIERNIMPRSMRQSTQNPQLDIIESNSRSFQTQSTETSTRSCTTPITHDIATLRHEDQALLHQIDTLSRQTDQGQVIGQTLSGHEADTESVSYQTSERVATSFNLSDEPEPYYFTNAWILDGGSERHVCNSPLRNQFTKTRDASRGSYVQCGLTKYSIIAYGNCILNVKLPSGGYTNITVTDVALCPYFRTNLLSTNKLELKGLHLITLNGGYMCPETDVTRKLYIPIKQRSYWCLEFNPPTHHQYAKDPRESTVSYYTEKEPTKRELALEKKLTATATDDKWHLRLGHPGPQTLKHLPNAVQGNISVSFAPTTIECEVCTVSKAQQKISRSEFKEHPSTRPFQRVNFDLIPMPVAYNGHKYLSHFSCDFCDFIFNFTHRRKNECVQCFFYVVNLIKTQWNLDVQIFHTDGETSFGKEDTPNNIFWDFVRKRGIIVEVSAPRTQSQNGSAEIIGRWVTVKMRTLRIQSGQPKETWPERALAVAVINNRVPIIKNGWKSPYEVVWQVKPVIYHLIVYGAKAWPLNKTMSQLDREDPRAFIGYMVGYEGTGIYRVWIPSQNKVIRTRDVVFDEDDHVYDPSEIDAAILFPEHIETRLVIKPLSQIQYDVDVSSIELSDNTADTAEVQPRSPIIESIESSDDDHFSTPRRGSTASDKQQDEDTSSKGGDTVIGSLTNTPPTEYTPSTTSATPQASNSRTTKPTPKAASKSASRATSTTSSRLSSVPSSSSSSTKAKAKVKPGYSYTKERPRKEISSDNVPIFEGSRTRGDKRKQGPAGSSFYTTYEDTSEWNSAFSAFITSVKQHRDNLPAVPETYEEAKLHPLWPQWLEAMLSEIQHCKKKGVFKVVSHISNLTPKPLPLKWVYTYKFDGDGYLIRLKARLCVRGDKQPLNGMDTYAATLASEVMRFLLSMAAYFGLEMAQYDAVTAFLNSKLDEIVYTFQPPGFAKKGQLWLLLMALYGLRRSPHLWHNEISSFLQSLGLMPIPGVNCVYHNDWLIVFFFVDDIICLYRSKDYAKFKQFEAQLSAKYELRFMGEPEHFLGIRITRNREKNTINLCQDAYIDKMVKKFESSLLPHKVYTPLPPGKLALYEGQASPAQIKEMQEKVGHLGYAAHITRPDIAYATSHLAEFQKNPSSAHLHAVNHCMSYLRDHKNLSIQYSGPDTLTPNFHLSHVSTDASFADDLNTRKSRQGFLLMLAGGPVAWKATKQKTVTTSSTEAELLAASYCGKEVIWWKRFFAAIGFNLGEDLTIKCDNQMTIRLLTSEAVELSTKLRHVDIHHHWLRQEILTKNIHIEYLRTQIMPADGLTKGFTRQQQENFILLLNLVRITLTNGPRAAKVATPVAVESMD